MLRDHHLMPIAATFVGVGLLSLMDALMKGASLAVGVYSAVLLRAIVGAALAAPLWWFWGQRLPSRGALRLHIIRGVIATFMGLSFFFALTKLPLAVAISLGAVAPIVALYLAAILLGETITRRAIIASFLGLAGTVVIVAGQLARAQASDGWWLGVASVLLFAVLYAWNLILLRQQAQIADPAEIALYQNLVVAVLTVIAAPWLLVWPDTATLGHIGGSAMLTVLSLLALAWAYRRAEAQVLVPIEYSGFLWAALFGWLFFAEKVELATIAGATLIVSACWIGAPRSRLEQVAA